MKLIMPRIWKPYNFTASQVAKNMTDGIFKVPSYQRSSIWTKGQKEKFVDTIKKGYPFGTILLYYDENTKIYEIIDGFQRCSTIKDFVHYPTQFFQDKDINQEIPEKLIKCAQIDEPTKEDLEEILKLLKDWVKNTLKTMEAVEGIQFYDFAKYFINVYPKAKDNADDIVNIVKESLTKYKETCTEYKNIDVPVIIVEKDRENLPEIFELINSTGSKLSKYDLMAASWGDEKTEITSKKFLGGSETNIVTYNSNRYAKRATIAQISDFDPVEFQKKNELNLFEISFGFGKMLSTKYPYLFNHNSENDVVESIGFTLINSCLGEKNNNLKNMKTNIFKSKIDINKCLEKILESVEYIDGKIGKYTTFKLNSQTKKNSDPLHTEFQVVSMIASVFLAKYSTIISENKIEKIQINLDQVNEGWKTYNIDFSKNANKRYIIDTVDGRWKGSGDNKLDSAILNRDYYCSSIDKTKFENSLRNWYGDPNKNNKKSGKIAPPQEAEKLILSTIYLHIFAANDQCNKSKYDIEHLAPKKLMSKRLEKYGNLKLPISSIGNLCLLPQAENRSKKDETIYSKDSKYLENSRFEISELESKFTFTTEGDMSFLLDESLEKDDFKNKYMEFIDKRFDTMLNKILANYDNL